MRNIFPTVRSKIMILIFISFCILTACGLYVTYILCQPTNTTDNASIIKRSEIKTIIWNVGDLAPLPHSAKIKEIKTEGNMLTRSFHLSFSADKSDIKQWLAASKGVSKGKLYKQGNILKYVLNPRCGYNYGEVTVNNAFSIVYIYIAWS